jgi:hypothetical protein
MNRIFIGIYFCGFLTGELEKGFLLDKSEIKGFYTEGNDQKVVLTVNYPFQADNFKEYGFEKVEKCHDILKKFEDVKIQSTINNLFQQGKILLENRLSIRRTKRQAALIGLGAIFTSFLYEKTIGIFNNNRHEVPSSQHLAEDLVSMVCSITYNRNMNRLVADEARAHEIVRHYFENISTDLSIINDGRIRGSHLEFLFLRYCREINTKESCLALLEYQMKMAKIIDFGFSGTNFTMHFELSIPHLTMTTGELYEVNTFNVPVKDTKIYRKPKLSNIIVLDNWRFEEKECVGNKQTYFVCYKRIWKTTLADFAFQITYQEIESNFNCTVEPFDSYFVVSNRIVASLAVFGNTTIVETTEVPPGVHIFDSRNALISCGIENYKIFDSMVRNSEISVLEKETSTRKFQPNLSGPIITEIYGQGDLCSRNWVNITIGVILVLSNASLWVLFIKNYKINRISNEEISLKSFVQ